MTTATSTQGKTEFMVSPNTSSKELFDQLNELKADKGANADLPIRAYDKGSKPPLPIWLCQSVVIKELIKRLRLNPLSLLLKAQCDLNLSKANDTNSFTFQSFKHIDCLSLSEAVYVK